MASTASDTKTIALHYCLPESAHRQLCDMRDALQQLADLAACSDPKARPLKVDARPIFTCFANYASELTSILDSGQWRRSD
ncbi:hypothetical protein SAMN05216570_4225 [Dyella sp. OK004]|uniref:XAC0095 family protein n=1 Tax=Dyella sp. OK004 TaxID=1855292 RepID=UPI0008E5325D|nr:hypothetical protein [Dyella sp. OK004]SFS20004.1 hypothetical protein SAMN05216570_4225 [Dyella sp. OK004]